MGLLKTSTVRVTLRKPSCSLKFAPNNGCISPISQTLFSSTPSRTLQNRILDPVRIPPTFYDYLRVCSANNTLLLALFTTSACAPCRTITPLLTSLVDSRSPKPSDKFSALAFAELELDSPDTSNGPMTDLGVEWGIKSMPTLVGFGGSRAERMTERLTDTKMLADKGRMEEWLDKQMESGDPNAVGGGGGSSGSSGKGILARLFG